MERGEFITIGGGVAAPVAFARARMLAAAATVLALCPTVLLAVELGTPFRDHAILQLRQMAETVVTTIYTDRAVSLQDLDASQR